jgi:hypothetical protein
LFIIIVSLSWFIPNPNNPKNKKYSQKTKTFEYVPDRNSTMQTTFFDSHNDVQLPLWGETSDSSQNTIIPPISTVSLTFDLFKDADKQALLMIVSKPELPYHILFDAIYQILLEEYQWWNKTEVGQIQKIIYAAINREDLSKEERIELLDVTFSSFFAHSLSLESTNASVGNISLKLLKMFAQNPNTHFDIIGFITSAIYPKSFVDPLPRWRANLLWTLFRHKKMPQETLNPMLKELLDYTNDVTRNDFYAAITLLDPIEAGLLNTNVSLDILLEAAQHKSPEIRNCAKRTLCERGILSAT